MLHDASGLFVMAPYARYVLYAKIIAGGSRPLPTLDITARAAGSRHGSSVAQRRYPPQKMGGPLRRNSHCNRPTPRQLPAPDTSAMMVPMTSVSLRKNWFSEQS